MKRQYIMTERAHFMCPNMHFAILAEIKGSYQKERTIEILNKQAKAHPFLRAQVKMETDTDKLYYNIKDDSQIYFEEVIDKKTYADIMNEISKQEWNVFHNGLLRVYAFPNSDTTKILFVAHHLLCDGRGLLHLVAEFSDAYSLDGNPVYSEEHLITRYDDLPKGSKLPWISRMLVRNANKVWKKENKKVNYDLYAKVSDEYGVTHENIYQEKIVADLELQSLMDTCHENRISINDYLSAEFCKQYDVNKLIVAADIRADLAQYQDGALGNYSTAFSILPKCKGSIVERAKEIQKLNRHILSNNAKKMLVLSCYLELDPTLLDAAAISALGGFDSKAGKFVGGTMFGMDKPLNHSVTNLGRIESESLISAMFIPPSSPAILVTMGVVTVNKVMKICYSKNKN